VKLKTLRSGIASAPGRLATAPSPDSWRAGKTTTERGYGYRWQQARLRFLVRHPLCCYCEREGLVTVATVVDHVRAHQGDQTLFWDESNWASLCASHHSSAKQREEKSGTASVRFGEDGWPVGG
jgi:5-methylcytosine-specific restriction protein A